MPTSGSYHYPVMQKPQGWSYGSFYTTKNLGSWIQQGGGWKDITANIEVRGVAATDPDWAQIGTGPFYAYKFAVGDYIWMTFHIDHDYSMGTPIFLHTHWIPDGTDTNSVKWEFVYSIAKGHNQEAFDPVGTTVSAEQAPPGTAYQHMVTEITAGIGADVIEPDTLLMVRIGRVTNGGVDNANGIFLLTADCHHQADKVATKNRSPNFFI